MDEYYLDEYCKQVERENNDALRRFSLSLWHKGIAKEEQNYMRIFIFGLKVLQNQMIL